jgi:6-phosphofructokinase 2
MPPIVTLTLNPSIDAASEAERVRPTHKIRTTNERFDPGGGGVNVARVIAELGGTVLPVYLRGGVTGGVLDGLLAERGFETCPVDTAGGTRVSQTVYERGTGLEYRFVPEGPRVTADEWARCLRLIDRLDFDWLVASGSPPRGLPEDAYAELARRVRARGARYVLDTSGPALDAALGEPGVHLVKPSLGEFRALTGLALEDTDAVAEAAAALRRERGVELVAVTMGHEGAVLAAPDGVHRLKPPALEVKSATGAGDSFLGAMVFALAEGRAPRDAFALATAAGTAAVLTPGTELCRSGDVWRFYRALAGGRFTAPAAATSGGST